VNNGWINTTNVSEWNAITQSLTVTPNTWYQLSGWIQTSTPFGAGYFGVRDASNHLISETTFGALGSYTQLSIWFWSGSNTSVRTYAGYWTPSGGVDTWMRVDDLRIEQ
jgi:hypothetical protein